VCVCIYIYRSCGTSEAPVCEGLCQYNLHATKKCAVVTLQTRRATEDARVEAEEMIGEGQDIATGTVSASLLYNLLHLSSRKRCPIPRKRQSLLSVRPSFLVPAKRSQNEESSYVAGLSANSQVYSNCSCSSNLWSGQRNIIYVSMYCVYSSYLDLAHVRLPLLQSADIWFEFQLARELLCYEMYVTFTVL